MFTIHVIVIALILLLIFTYLPYYSPFFIYLTSRGETKLLDRIDAMKKLVNSPAIGHFFYE